MLSLRVFTEGARQISKRLKDVHNHAPVGNDKDCRRFKLFLNHDLNLLVRLWVDLTGRLIEHEHARVPEESALWREE